MEFRFERTGIIYLPQFKQVELGDTEWNYFTKDTFDKNSILGAVSRALTRINNINGYEYGQYWLKDDKTKRVFFKEEYQVMAFLGAAKSYYSREIKKFTL